MYGIIFREFTLKYATDPFKNIMSILGFLSFERDLQWIFINFGTLPSSGYISLCKCLNPEFTLCLAIFLPLFTVHSLFIYIATKIILVRNLSITKHDSWDCFEWHDSINIYTTVSFATLLSDLILLYQPQEIMFPSSVKAPYHAVHWLSLPFVACYLIDNCSSCVWTCSYLRITIPTTKFIPHWII